MTTEQKYISYQFTAFNQDLEKAEMAIPQPTGNQVVVRVDFCGVCHSDVHIHEGYYSLGDGKKLSLADRGINLPVTLGHEIVGKISAVGPDCQDVKVGDQVLVYPWIGCGKCSVCKRGEENLCMEPAALGVHKPGGYAEYVLVPDARYVMGIGKLEPAHASLLACSGLTTYSAVKKIGHVYEDESVVVVGCGGLGLLAIRTLALKGVKNIIALDLAESKRELAKQMGATHVFDPTADDALTVIQQAAKNNCVAVLDFVGSGPTVALAINLPRKGGKVILVGLHGGELRYPIPFIITRALTILGSYTGTLPEQKELIEFANQHDLLSLPIATVPLSEASSALNQLAEGKVNGRLVLDNR